MAVGDVVPDSQFHEHAALIERWFRAAVAAADPAEAVRRHLGRDRRELIVADRRFPIDGRLVLLAVGKAACAMARGADDVASDLIGDGIVITKDGHADRNGSFPWPVVEAAHPVPDERGVRATRRALALVERLGPGDVVLALISGGGSSLLEAPRPPVTLADMAATTDLMLRAGAPIQDLNAVRTPLSLVKGGRLRRAAGDATAITLILSDVLGNDPRVIASGPTVPTVPTERTGAEAIDVLRRYDLLDSVPPTVREALSVGESVPAIDEIGSDVVQIVGDNATAVRAVEMAASADSYRPRVVWHERTGEAADLGRDWGRACRFAPPAVDVLLGGGEATVTVRGGGIGGRNTEFALAAAIALADADDRGWTIASLATDGDDGPTGAAGAVADVGTVARAAAAGVDAIAALERNDSRRVFEAADGLVRTGPTGTNVNDLYLALRRR